MATPSSAPAVSPYSQPTLDFTDQGTVRSTVLGVPKEIKHDEHRVGLVVASVELLVKDGHKVIVQSGAGEGSCCSDEQYAKAGAEVVATKEEVWSRSDIIVKVKEPQREEWPLIRPGQVLFMYFHFAANPDLITAMIERKAVCIAYETVEDSKGGLPLLVPMSQVAGRMAVQEGAKYLEKPFSGRGVLLCGIPGVAPANVLIIGGGVVGINAAKVAAGFGAIVKILDTNNERLNYLSEVMPANVIPIYSTPHAICTLLPEADLVIGAVYVRGDKCPKLITRDHLRLMKPGSCLVDVSIDQGGLAETSRPTTHTEPTFIVEGVNHYCVANIPGAVPNTSTYALTNATIPYIRHIANVGWATALHENKGLLKGLNVVDGVVTYKEVAKAGNVAFVPAEEVIKKHLTNGH